MDRTKKYFIITVIIAFGLFGATIAYNEFTKEAFYIVESPEGTEIFTFTGKLVFSTETQVKEELKDGKDGLVYTDKSAGFTIQKPNESWYFETVDDYIKNSDLGFDPRTNAYLGGVFVATDVPGNVMIISEKLPENLDLNEHIDDQISRAEELFGKEATVTKKFVSPSGNWAVFEGFFDFEEYKEYGRQILHKTNDKLFLIQTTGDPPNEMDEKIKSDLNQIVESFSIID